MRHLAVWLTLTSLLMPVLGRSARAQELADANAARHPRFLLAKAGGTVPLDIARTPVLMQRLALDLDGVSLREALRAITSRTGLRLVYNDDVVPLETRVHLKADDIAVAPALMDVLLDTGIDVVFHPDGHAALVKRGGGDALPPAGAIVGQVTDRKTGAAIAGATIVVDGISRSTATGSDGRYRITDVAPGTYTVRARYIGYAPGTASVTVGADEEVRADISLEKSVQRLDEVVTTVTGDQHLYEIGNTIGRISADSSVPTAPITSLGDLINARVAGAQVLLGDGFSGSGPRLRLRGINSFSVSNDPIVILDGTRIESGPSVRAGLGAAPGRLGDLSPDEIESIEVVKGPSAATLYGTDAANGVLVVKTKSGAGGRPKWSSYAQVGSVTLPGRYRANYYAWGHAPGGAVMQCTLLLLATGSCVQDSLSTLNLFTDPTRTPLDAGLRQEYGTQVSGGSPALRYFLSVGYQSEVGGLRLQGAELRRFDSISGGHVLDEQFRPSAYHRTNLRGNLSATVTDRLQLTLSTGFIDGLTRLPIGSVFTSQVFGLGYVDANGGWSGGSRPSDLFAIRSTEDVTRFTGSLGANWRIADWLQSHATAGVDFSSAFQDGLQRLGQGYPFFPTGYRTNRRINATLYSVDLGVNAANRVSSALSLRTSVGAQYNRRNGINLSATASGLAPGAGTLTGAAVTTTTEATDQSVVAGAYVQETAAFSDRLFLTGALRADGAGSFGSNFNAALYPKASVSWLISSEPFFPHGLGISSLRVRAAYGASGVQPGAIAALTTLRPLTGFVDGQAQSGLVQATIGNPNLKPERQRELEGGLDLELLRGRVRLEGTYYHRRSSDALFDANLGPSAGVGNQFINLGAVQNEGWEGTLDVRVLDSRSIALDLTANGSINSNTLLALGSGVTVGSQRQLWSQVVGYPLYGWWDRPLLGYADANHNGIVEPGEVRIADTAQFIGSTVPTRQLTLGSTVTLFHGLFAISTLMDHRGGYVEPAYSLIYGCLFAANCQAVNDPKTPVADQARAVAAIGFDTAPYTVSGAFWRWRELSVTANLPPRVARTIGARSLGITVSGRNLALWTSFPGVDPEGTINPGSDFSGESLSAPAARYWLLRVNVGY